MKKIWIYMLLALCAAGLAGGCAAGKRSRGPLVTVTPSPLVVVPDSSSMAAVDVTFRVSGECFTRRSRLFVFPQVLAEDTLYAAYPPLVLDAPVFARKMRRRQVLTGYEDPYAGSAEKVRYARDYEFPCRMDIAVPQSGQGRVVAVVSAEGCGRCSARDTVEVAGIADPLTLLGDLGRSLRLAWLEPEFRPESKAREGRGVARLQFAINASDIRLDRGDNREQMENMFSELRAVAGDSLAELNTVVITGAASADGPLSYNTALARRRALSAREWLSTRMAVPQDARKLISVASYPEGWEPVLAAMTAADDPDSLAVKAILERYADAGDDVQEYHIRRLPAWERIKTRYLPRERRVEYYYAYTVRSFADDDELLSLYGVRPDAFSEGELLRVAALQENPRAKRAVYETVVQYYPRSQAGNNNLAVLLLAGQQGDEAVALLEELPEPAAEVLGTLAAGYFSRGEYDRAAELLQQVHTPEAHYNLGLVRARQRRLDEAYGLLKPFGDRNSAVLALSLGRNGEAAQILAALDDRSPAAEYARAIVAARAGGDEDFYRHLHAASADGALRGRAAGEADFAKYRNDARFKASVNDGLR